MGEAKREALHNRMFYLLNDEEEELKEKKRRELQLKHEEEARKRKIVVKTIFDLTEKYEDYDVKVDSYEKIITLRRELLNVIISLRLVIYLLNGLKYHYVHHRHHQSRHQHG